MRAWQSSTLDASVYSDPSDGLDWSPSADKVVDGDTDGAFWHRSCSHTEERVLRPWLAINLQSTKYIAGMRITNRQDGDCCQGGESYNCCAGEHCWLILMTACLAVITRWRHTYLMWKTERPNMEYSLKAGPLAMCRNTGGWPFLQLRCSSICTDIRAAYVEPWC